MILLLSSLAHADVGPPPSCPEGTHREYLYGHRCVKDGHHLQTTESGEVIEVADPTPAPTEPREEPPPAAPPPIPEVPVAPPKEASRCATTPMVAGWLGALALLAVARRRR